MVAGSFIFWYSVKFTFFLVIIKAYSMVMVRGIFMKMLWTNHGMVIWLRWYSFMFLGFLCGAPIVSPVTYSIVMLEWWWTYKEHIKGYI